MMCLRSSRTYLERLASGLSLNGNTRGHWTGNIVMALPLCLVTRCNDPCSNSSGQGSPVPVCLSLRLNTGCKRFARTLKRRNCGPRCTSALRMKLLMTLRDAVRKGASWKARRRRRVPSWSTDERFKDYRMPHDSL